MPLTLLQMKRKFFAPVADPLPSLLGDAALIRVDPCRIVLYSETLAERYKGRKFLGAFLKSRERFILPGRWDRTKQLFRASDRYQLAEELRAHAFDYTKTSRFRFLLEKVEKGEAVKLKGKERPLRSEAEVHAYLQQHVDVCKSMQKFGYLPEKSVDHICIMVGRRGDLIKEIKGRHRLAIAQVFGVSEVVALIRHVHPGWVKRCVKEHPGLPLHEVLKRSFRELEEENRSVAGNPDEVLVRHPWTPDGRSSSPEACA